MGSPSRLTICLMSALSLFSANLPSFTATWSVPISPSAVAFETGPGFCRVGSGHGTYTPLDGMDRFECQDKCAESDNCVAYEWRASLSGATCEMHSEKITSVFQNAASKLVNAECGIKPSPAPPLAPLAPPSQPGNKWWASHRDCTESLIVKVAVSASGTMPGSATLLETPLSRPVEKDFVYSGSQGCFHNPMFQAPANSPWTTFEPVQLNWYVEKDGVWYFQAHTSMDEGWNMVSRTISTETAYPPLAPL